MFERLWRPLVLAAIGIVLVVIGLRIDPAAAECGSRPLGPGQICDIVGKSGPVRKTYDDIVAEREGWRRTLPLAGGVLILGAGAWVVVALRRRPPTDELKHPARPQSPSHAPVDRQADVTTAPPWHSDAPAQGAPSRPGGWQHAHGATAVSRRGVPAPGHQPDAGRNNAPRSQDTPPRRPGATPAPPRTWTPQPPRPSPSSGPASGAYPPRQAPSGPAYPGRPPQGRGPVPPAPPPR